MIPFGFLPCVRRFGGGRGAGPQGDIVPGPNHNLFLLFIPIFLTF